jgi:PAS domain S-box-containing protein
MKESDPSQNLTTPVSAIAQGQDITGRKRVDEAPWESEASYRAAEKMAHLGHWERDFRTGRTSWSEGVCDVFGLPPGSAAPPLDEFLALVHPEDRAPLKQAVEAALASGQALDAEFRIQRADGELRHIHTRGMPVRDAAGEFHILSGILQDITERKRAEAALRESEERYRSLVTSSIDAVLLTAPDGRILGANEAACRMFGRSEQELIQVGRSGVLDGSDPRLAPAFEERARTGRFRGELTLMRKDGTRFPGEVSSAYFTGRQGGLLTSMVIRDATERVRMEEELRESAASTRARADELATLLAATPALTFIAHDPDCRRMTSSDAALRLLRLPAGANSSKSAPPGERPETFRALKDGRELRPEEMPLQLAAATGQAVKNFELTLAVNDGTSVDTVGDAIPLFDAEGKVRGAVGAFLDITERKRAEEGLRASHRFLEIANRHTEMIHLLREFVTEVRSFTGCAAAGLRILDAEGNIPRQACEVFSQRFYGSEDPLLIRSDQCLSISVIKRTAGPKLSFYTESISFYNACNQLGYRCVAVVPIRSGDSIIGLIHMADYQENTVPLELVETLEEAGMQLGAAIQRVQAEEKTRRLSRELLAARENERKQVSSALHHDVGSLAVGISVHLDAIEADIRSGKPGEALKWTKRTRKLFGESVVRLKGLATQLRPLELDVLGLPAALRQCFSQARECGDTRIHFRETLGRRRVAGDAATTLFRIAQEALTNASSHGHAKRVAVDLGASKKEVRLTVRDNGKGFDPHGHRARKTSQIGLRVMQEMAIHAGGACLIDSTPGKGTVVRVSLPLKNAALEPGDARMPKETAGRGKAFRSAGRGPRPRRGSHA